MATISSKLSKLTNLAQWCNKTSGLSMIVVKGSAKVVIN